MELSEEEIIKNIKEMIQWSDHNTYKMALQGLLDLYNKEKEKNIPLIIDGKSINAYADEIEDLLSIEDGTPVYFSIGEKQAIKIISEYCRNSVPKSEIKEILDDIDNNKPIIAETKLRKLLEEE